jgi:hypothetical protein
MWKIFCKIVEMRNGFIDSCQQLVNFTKIWEQLNFPGISENGLNIADPIEQNTFT